jgi:hypothetical protein
MPNSRSLLGRMDRQDLPCGGFVTLGISDGLYRLPEGFGQKLIRLCNTHHFLTNPYNSYVFSSERLFRQYKFRPKRLPTKKGYRNTSI